MTHHVIDVQAPLETLAVTRRKTRGLPLVLLGALILAPLWSQAAPEEVPIGAREPEALANSLVLRKGSFATDACRLIDRISRQRHSRRICCMANFS